SEHSYLIIRDTSFNISFWIPPVAQKLVEAFGSCLIIEAWLATDGQEEDVQIHVARKNAQAIAQYMNKQIQADGLTSSVKLVTGTLETVPIHTPPLVDVHDKNTSHTYYSGLSIPPNYIVINNNEKILPIALRQFREALSRSLSKTFFEFVRI